MHDMSTHSLEQSVLSDNALEIDEVIKGHGGWPGAFVTAATQSA